MFLEQPCPNCNCQLGYLRDGKCQHCAFAIDYYQCFNPKTGFIECYHGIDDPVCTGQLEAMIWRRKMTETKAIHPADTKLFAESPYQRKLKRLNEDLKMILTVAPADDAPELLIIQSTLEQLLRK